MRNGLARIPDVMAQRQRSGRENRFSCHNCSPGFGVDIATHQLFLYSPDLGRRLLFDASIDCLIISVKLAVFLCFLIQKVLFSQSPVLPMAS
jgi:hypothetical protein